MRGVVMVPFLRSVDVPGLGKDGSLRQRGLSVVIYATWPSGSSRLATDSANVLPLSLH